MVLQGILSQILLETPVASKRFYNLKILEPHDKR